MNDIEILEEYTKHDTDLVNLPEYDAKTVYKAIENLINRVKELEHQNNILKEKNQDYKCNYNTMAEQKEKAMERVKELEEYKEYYEDMEEVNKKFIAVDKIKAKIEEVKNSKENYTFEKLTSEDIRRTIITNLQELLEEDKNEYTYKEIVDYGKNKYFDNIH